MRDQSLFDQLDRHLISVLHTVSTLGNVWRAAIRLGVQPPAVSGAPKRLPDDAGHPLLLRSGFGRVASSVLLGMTLGQFCERCAGRLPLTLLACPGVFPTMVCDPFWHGRSHTSEFGRGWRLRVEIAAASLCTER